MPILGAFMFNAIYKIPAYRFACTNVFTNKTLTDAYRGAGRPEATFAIERIMDELAVELGMDPMELREKNWIKHEEFPFTTVCRADLRLRQLRGRDRARRRSSSTTTGCAREQAEAPGNGDPVQLGIGISTFTEMCGLAPSRVLGSLSYGAGGWEHASIRMLPTGKVEVVTGSSAHGQGHETAWSQIVADQLGRPVRGRRGPARRHAVVAQGHGHLRLAVPGRRAGSPWSRRRRRWSPRPSPIAAHMLECRRGRPGVRRAASSPCGAPTSPTTIQDVALAVFAAHDLPDGVEPSLDSDATVDPENFSFPHGTHLCATEVDTETGRVSLRSYVCVDDIGMVVNPLIVEGQVHGGLAQGIAQALFEEAVHDESGTLTTGTFADYLLPSAADLPLVHHRPHRDAVDHEPVGRQGSRRGRHHRVHPGGGQRGDRRGAALRRERHRDAVTPMRVWPAISTADRRRWRRREAGGGLGSIDATGGTQ